ncbi:MAG: PQQ-binding-like beta-propeller repeat protein, partial [Actinomycetota bacterium]
TAALGLLILVVVSTAGTTCGQAFSATPTNLEPTGPGPADQRLDPDPDSGLGRPAWALQDTTSTGGAALIDVGSWTAFVSPKEISRIDPDGTVAWTRTGHDTRVIPMGDDRLGHALGIDDTVHLAVMDADGGLVRCDRLAARIGDMVGDGSGGYLTVDLDSTGDRQAAVLRRVEADGSQRWRRELGPGSGESIPNLFVGDGIAAVGLFLPAGGPDQPVLMAFDDRNGQPIWTRDGTTDIERVERTLGLLDDTLYLVAIDPSLEDGARERLAAVDAGTGDTRWVVPLPGDDVRAAQIVAGPSRPLIVGADSVTAIETDSGRVRWRVTADPSLDIAQGVWPSQPIEDGDRVIQPLAGGGAMVDLADGTWTPMVSAEERNRLDGLAIDGDVLLASVTLLDR